MGRANRISRSQGSTLLMVLFLFFFLSLTSSFLLPMMMIHYQSIIHYKDNVTLDRLALGVKKLVLEHLSSDWVSYYDSGWVTWDLNVQYRYSISASDENNRSFKVWVKDENVERSYLGVVSKSDKVTNLNTMAGYGVYSTEDIYLEDIGQIYSEPPLIGIATLKDLNIYKNSNIYSLKLHTNGNIYMESLSWKNFNDYLVVSNCSIPYFSGKFIDEFICLLNNNYSDKMVIEGNQYSLNLNLDTFSPSRNIIVLENIANLNLQGSFNGLVIIRNCENLEIENVDLNGILVVSNSNVLEMKNTCITGAFGLVDSACLTRLDLTLKHDVKVISGLYEYLAIEVSRQPVYGQLYIEEFTETQ